MIRDDLYDLVRLERGEGLPPSPAPPTPEAEVAQADVLIERTDVGPGVFTQIRAGERIPVHLAGFPRRPADGEVAPKPKRRTRRPLPE